MLVFEAQPSILTLRLRQRLGGPTLAGQCRGAPRGDGNGNRSNGGRMLYWESRRHVGDMSARQPKVGTFGRQSPDEPTQIRSRHIILCRGLPTFSKFSLSTRGTYGVIIVQTGMYKY